MDPSIEYFSLINTLSRTDEGASPRAETPNRRPGRKKKLLCRVRDEEKKRDKSENGEIHNKNTLGNRRDEMFLQETRRPRRIVFLRENLVGQNRSEDSLIDVACSTA
jgi:hypothetical protein